MKKTKIVPASIEVIDAIICNNCGEEYGDEYRTCIGLDAYADGGYWSKVFNDGETFWFNMCEACLIELFENFKIKPEGDNRYNFND